MIVAVLVDFADFLPCIKEKRLRSEFALSHGLDITGEKYKDHWRYSHKKKEVPDNSKGEDRQDSGKLCFPPVEYNQRTEKERQQFNGEIIETLYPFLKEFYDVPLKHEAYSLIA